MPLSFKFCQMEEMTGPQLHLILYVISPAKSEISIEACISMSLSNEVPLLHREVLSGLTVEPQLYVLLPTAKYSQYLTQPTYDAILYVLF